jgi:hypothetical protein
LGSIRLISTTLGEVTTQFSYNGDGVRLKQIVADTPTTYMQDPSTGSEQALAHPHYPLSCIQSMNGALFAICFGLMV